MTNKLNYFSIDDATYAYRVAGKGDPIVLLHGFTGSMLSWKILVDKWKTNYQVITIDLPGHGKTYSKTPKTMKTFSDDLYKLLQHLNIEKAHLVGYSMGGRVALSFYNYYPDAVQSLILESSSPGLQTEDEREKRIKQDEQIIKQIRENLTCFVNFWEAIPLFATHIHLAESVKREMRDERLMQSPKGLIDSLTYMGIGVQPSWWGQLKHINVPTLLIVGEHDEKFININKLMKKQINNSEISIISNSGHTPHIEEPEKFDKIVLTHMNHLKIHQ